MMKRDPLSEIFTSHYQQIPIKRGQFFKQKKFDLNYLGLTFYQRITTFALVIIIAMLFLIFSFTRLLSLITNPIKFVFPYSLSIFLFFNSLGLVFGFRSYYSTLLERRRRNYTLVFFGCTLMSLWVTIRGYGYFWCLGVVFFQIVSFLVFCVSFIPGGSDGLSSLLNMMLKR